MITWLLIPICSESFATCSMDKMFVKSKYSRRTIIRALSIFNGAINTLRKRKISLKMAKDVIKIMSISFFRLRAAVANCFYSTYSTCLVVEKILGAWYNLYLSMLLLKLTSTLLKIKKDILKATYMLMLANRKGFLKKQDFLSLSFT